MTRIAVLGAAAVDTIVKVDQFPAADEIVFAQSLEKYPGGSTANVAVGLKRLGLETAFLGKAGGDTEGRIIKADFEKEGVDTSYLIIEQEAPSA
ncbi:MAG: carbohydrate kinase family protein, partial [Bacillota bacterium]